MSLPKGKEPERNAGAFYSSDGVGMNPVPMRTLSDDYQDVPAEPADDRVPEPEPPGFIRRIVDRLSGRSSSAP
jgi:hypothetical protein